MCEKEVLIVGANGFLGHHLGLFLTNALWEVSAASTKNIYTNKKFKQVINLNLPLHKKIKQIFNLKLSIIIYTSSKYHNDSLIENFYVNFLLPLILAIYARIKKIKFIYIGTIWQFFPKYSKEFLNRYSISKFCLTIILKILNFKNSNKINVIIIGDTFGDHDMRKKLIPYILKCEKNNLNPIIKNPTNYISLSHVNDVVTSIVNISLSSNKFMYFCVNSISIRVDDLHKIIKMIYKSTDSLVEIEDFYLKCIVDTNLLVRNKKLVTTSMQIIPNLISTIEIYKKKDY